MDFEPYFKVHSLVSVHPINIILGQMTNINMIFHMVVSVKVTVDLQGCLPKNHSYARRLCYNHRKVYITVKLIKCKIRRNKHF